MCPATSYSNQWWVVKPCCRAVSGGAEVICVPGASVADPDSDPDLTLSLVKKNCRLIFFKFRVKKLNFLQFFLSCRNPIPIAFILIRNTGSLLPIEDFCIKPKMWFLSTVYLKSNDFVVFKKEQDVPVARNFISQAFQQNWPILQQWLKWNE